MNPWVKKIEQDEEVIRINLLMEEVKIKLQPVFDKRIGEPVTSEAMKQMEKEVAAILQEAIPEGYSYAVNYDFITGNIDLHFTI